MNLNPATRIVNALRQKFNLHAVGYNTTPFWTVYTGAELRDTVVSQNNNNTTAGIAFKNNKVVTANRGSSPCLRKFTVNNNGKIDNRENQSTSGNPFNSNSVEFSPTNNNYVVTYSANPWVTIMDVTFTGSFAYVQTGLSGISSTCNDATYNYSGDKIAVANSTSNGSRVYNTSDYSVITALTHSGACNGIAFSPNGEYLALATNSSPFIYVYNTSDWSNVPLTGSAFTAANHGVHFSPDGLILGVAGYGVPYLERYTTSNWTRMDSVNVVPPGRCRRIKFSKDGRYVSLASDLNVPYVTTYKYPSWEKINTPDFVPAGGVLCVAFNF